MSNEKYKFRMGCFQKMRRLTLGGMLFPLYIEWQFFRHMEKKNAKRGESRFSVILFPKGWKMPLNNGGIAPGLTQNLLKSRLDSFHTKTRQQSLFGGDSNKKDSSQKCPTPNDTFTLAVRCLQICTNHLIAVDENSIVCLCSIFQHTYFAVYIYITVIYRWICNKTFHIKL